MNLFVKLVLLVVCLLPFPFECIKSIYWVIYNGPLKPSPFSYTINSNKTLFQTENITSKGNRSLPPNDLERGIKRRIFITPLQMITLLHHHKNKTYGHIQEQPGKFKRKKNTRTILENHYNNP